LFILAVKKPVYESPKNTLSSLFICSIILSACTLNDFNSVSYNNNNITLPLSDEIGLIVTSQFNARSKVDSNFLISLYCALLRNFKRIFLIHYLFNIKAFFFVNSFLFYLFHNWLQEVFHLDFLLLLFNKFFFLTLNLVLLLILFTNLRKRSSDCFIL